MSSFTNFIHSCCEIDHPYCVSVCVCVEVGMGGLRMQCTQREECEQSLYGALAGDRLLGGLPCQLEIVVL